MFLDEIAEFPVELQAKLFGRSLQDGRFERLGSPKTVTVNVRIIAATNQDLEQAVRAAGSAPTFHRLNVFPIHVPPLRERRDDIPLLAWAFAETISRRMGKTIKGLRRQNDRSCSVTPGPAMSARAQ